MIRAYAGDTIILGLSAENIERLVELNQPIRVARGKHGHDGPTIVIYYGETEERLRAAIAPFVSNETVIRDETKPEEKSDGNEEQPG